MISKVVAAKKILRSYRRLQSARIQFAQDCQEVHEAGLTDERISQIIDGGYSRSRIQQLRNGKISKKDQNV